MAVIVVLFKAQYINDDSSISSEHIGPSRTAPRTTWQTWIPQGDQKYNLLDTNGRYWIQFVQDIRELYVRHREINPMGLPLLSFRDEEFSISGVLIYTIDNRNSQIRRIVTCMVRLIPQSTNETKCHPPISYLDLRRMIRKRMTQLLQPTITCTFIELPPETCCRGVQ